MTTRVWVTFEQEGWHSWPSAPPKTEYLRSSHRHMFHFKVECDVTKPDRQVEFHELKEQCSQAVWMTWPRVARGLYGLDFGHESCEMMAEKLLSYLVKFWPVSAVEVSEDGENGARVEV